MKVTHSNPTLILASERRGQGAKPDNPLDRAVSAASKGGLLKRVTIVATQPESDPPSLVYLRADYAEESTATHASTAAANAPPAGTSLVATSRTLARASSQSLSDPGDLVALAGTSARDPYGNSRSTARDSGLSAYLKPTEQYARTQRLSSGTSRLSTLLDVLA